MVHLHMPHHQFQTALEGVWSQESFFILCFKLHKEDIYVYIKQFRDRPYISDFLVLSETAN